ncbi:MAG TPA: hypothetical protein VMU54_21445 [Planctomycetota bacterium]|nr:hypothetical protein [Planctomycetota bacterium]
MRLFGLLASGLILLAPLQAGSQANPPARPAPKPSDNAGKKGTYLIKTSRPGCNYYVCVPGSYSEEKPAGLHLFFHGQNGQGGAPNFGTWSKFFLDPYNLIGINMQYEDGDNARDTEGKVKAAQEAIAQTIADYKIVAGRGVVCSFSGGGLPHALFYDGQAKNGRGATWPFCHAALYSSNYRTKPSQQKSTPMTFFISVGQGEWTLASLGADGLARMTELLGDTAQGAPSDLYFKVIKGKGHSIADEEVGESVNGFRRGDLAFAPFVYGPDYPEKEFRVIVEESNALLLGRAVTAIERLPEPLKAKGAKLREKIDARVQSVLALAKELAEGDPVLYTFYGPIFTRQLQGLPEAKELKEILSGATKRPAHSKTLALVPAFQKNYRSFFEMSGMMNPAQAPLLEQVKSVAGPGSQYGRMAADYLLLK